MKISKNAVLAVSVAVFTLFLSSCGSGGTESLQGTGLNGETGAIIVQLDLTKSKPGLSKISNDCVSYDVARVVITVSDSSSTAIKTGDFACQDGQGEVTEIPVQDNLIVRVELKDSSGNVRSMTEKSGVSIVGGVSTVVPVSLTEPDGRWGFMKWGNNKWGI